MSTPDAFDALLDPQMLREYREESAMSTPRPSAQCFAGNHSECTETMDTCNCTYRGGHKTSHAYANIEGVAAPLEPSRPVCLNIHYENEDGHAAMYQCQLDTGHSGAHDSHPDKPNEGMLWKDSSSAAVPLNSREFLLTKRGYSGRETIVTSLDKLCADLDEWAAAVSKKLQEELAASQRQVRKYKRYFCDKDTCSPLLDSCESETTCCLPCHLDTAEHKVAELEKEIAALRKENENLRQQLDDADEENGRLSGEAFK